MAWNLAPPDHTPQQNWKTGPLHSSSTWCEVVPNNLRVLAMLLLAAAKASPVRDGTRTLQLGKDWLPMLFIGTYKASAFHHATEQSPTTWPNIFHRQSMNIKSFQTVELPDKLASLHTPVHIHFRSSKASLHGHWCFSLSPLLRVTHVYL